MEIVSTNIKNAWNQAQNILIIANTKSNADIIFACLALLDFGKKNNKQIDLFSATLIKNKIWRHVAGRDLQPHIVEDLKPRLVINIDNKELKIDAVNLLKTDTGYQIQLDTAETKLIHRIKPRMANSISKYDLTIVVGPPTLSMNISEFTKKTLYISNQNIPAEILVDNVILFKASAKSFTIKVKEMFHVLNNEISPSTATLLLSGLISYSAAFTKNISANLFATVNELVVKGGDYHKSYNYAVNNLTAANIKLIGEGLVNIEQLKNGLYSCYLNQNQIKSLILKPKDIFKFSEIYNCKLALVFIEGQNINKAYLKTAYKEVNLKKILKTYQGKGNNYDGLILTNSSYKSFTAELITLLEKPL